MNNKKVHLFLIIFLIVNSILINSMLIFSQDVFSINDVIKIMKERYSKIQDYYGTIIYVNKKNENSSSVNSEGEIYYKFPNKLKVILKSPREMTIVTNGKKLWVYIPSLFIVGEQELSKKLTIDVDNSQKSISYLLDNYNFKFIEEKSLYDFNNYKVYKIIGTPKRVEAGFKSIELYVTEDGFIVYQYAITLDNKIISYYFKSVQFNIDIPDRIFEFESEIPDDVQIIKNFFG